MALAISSLPVPVSPRISTVVGHFETIRICSKMRRMAPNARPGCRSRGVWRSVRRIGVALAGDRLLFLRDFERQAHALADQVGHQLDEARAFAEQAVVGFVGLHRQHPLQRAADLDRARR
ncbi:MAG: hypothetical protein V5B36_06750 [Candidatus Accumulibacter sp. UW25]|jgi:hypothetical protein